MQKRFRYEGAGIRKIHRGIARSAQVRPRTFAGGAHAVGLFNLAAEEARIAVKWTDLGLETPKQIRDLWTHQNVKAQGPEFAATVPGHGVVLLRVAR